MNSLTQFSAKLEISNRRPSNQSKSYQFAEDIRGSDLGSYAIVQVRSIFHTAPMSDVYFREVL